MTTSKWTAQNIPDQCGRTALVTGANSGLGFHTSLELARRGAHVILACRSLVRGEQALQQIRTEVPDASLDLQELDLGSLASIRQFSERILGAYPRIDLLINNAGVMNLPYHLTEDGFEMQIAINHLGHFALTNLLLGPVTAADGSRVVTVSSLAHLNGSIHFDDLMGEMNYQSFDAYRQSKLANLLFSLELAEKLSKAGSGTLSLAAHPGISSTNLFSRGAEMRNSELLNKLSNLFVPLFSMPAAKGTLSQLYAATAPGVQNGDYFGPGGFREMYGYPAPARISQAAQNRETARRLWNVSEELTGVKFS